MFSETTIEEKEKLLPETLARHQFYQDLRGYLADLVECFNEKLANIKFVEDKYHKIKGDVTKKLIERRREDVRDQMRELSSVKSNVSYFLKQNSIGIYEEFRSGFLNARIIIRIRKVKRKLFYY